MSLLKSFMFAALLPYAAMTIRRQVWAHLPDGQAGSAGSAVTPRVEASPRGAVHAHFRPTLAFVVRGGRTLLVLAIASIALFGLSSPAFASQLAELQLVQASEQSLVQAINHARTARGVPPLKVGVRLQRAARAHSQAMARSGSFTHGNWYPRLRRHGVRARTLGETIAWGAGSTGTASAIVSMWLASPPHRATMLDPTFRRIGVGIAVGTMGGIPGAKVATADFAG